MLTNWTLEDWLGFQEQQHTQAIDLGLDRVAAVAHKLGLIEEKPFTISVAGTNGKGSSTASLSAIYTQAGYRTGWYSSPHLLRYNERISINNQAVSDQQLIRAFNAIYAVLDGMTLSYFEWGTLAALWLFKSEACDVQILEVGLGGRLDAVNVVDADAALITPIDVDHQAWLGSDREQIALEKAGVFRAKQVAVYSDLLPACSLLRHAQALDVDLRLAQRDYQWQSINAQQWQWRSAGQHITLSNPNLLGQFQFANVAGVVQLIELLQARLPVTQEVMQAGLQQIRLVGRLDYRQLQQTTWLFDVAHNPQSITALTTYLSSIKQEVGRIVLVFSALADKDIAAMLVQLKPHVDEWHIAPLGGERAASLTQLQTAVQASGLSVTYHNSIADACQQVQQLPVEALRLVSGSFVTVEQGLRWLEGEIQ